jgi:hypothetical protein
MATMTRRVLFWVLLSGRFTGANGPDNEMQVYAYDGVSFISQGDPKPVAGKNGFATAKR